MTAPYPTGVLSLDQIVSYTNDSVNQRVRANYYISETEANQLFIETLKFLWASASANHYINPINILDLVWNQMIIETKEYARFCHHYLGGFHDYTPGNNRRQQELAREANHAGFASQLKREIVTLCDLLGEETVQFWYFTLEVRYDAKFFAENTVLPQS